MADGKKSFVLYCDLIHTVDLLDDVLAGKLLKHLLRYVNDQNPETDDTVLKIAFEPIKRQLKRDLVSWSETRVERVKAGTKGGINSGKSRRKKQNKANEPNASKSKQTQANEAVTVTVNVNDTVNNNKRIRPDENFILDLPEIKINAAIEYITITKNVRADRPMIESLWTVFKQKNFTGENPYKSNSDIFRHFFESLKYEKLNGTSTHQRTIKDSKPGISDKRTKTAREW